MYRSLPWNGWIRKMFFINVDSICNELFKARIKCHSSHQPNLITVWENAWLKQVFNLFQLNQTVMFTPNKQQKQSCASVFFQGKVKNNGTFRPLVMHLVWLKVCLQQFFTAGQTFRTPQPLEIKSDQLNWSSAKLHMSLIVNFEMKLWISHKTLLGS